MVDRNAKKYEIEKILTAPDKGIHRTRGIGGILARLWRIMLDELKVSPNRFESLLTDFITDARRAVPWGARRASSRLRPDAGRVSRGRSGSPGKTGGASAARGCGA